MSKLWTKNGKLIVSGGKPILCNKCPCGEDDPEKDDPNDKPNDKPKCTPRIVAQKPMDGTDAKWNLTGRVVPGAEGGRWRVVEVATVSSTTTEYVLAQGSVGEGGQLIGAGVVPGKYGYSVVARLEIGCPTPNGSGIIWPTK